MTSPTKTTKEGIINNNTKNSNPVVTSEIISDEDPYLIELHKRLVEATKERKKIEEQSSHLNNRLNFLKGEEGKSLKDVETIKDKYRKKVSTMQKIENDLKERLELKQLREEELKNQQIFNKTMKTEITKNMKEKRDTHIKELIGEMIKLREAKKQNEDLMKHIKIEEQNTNKNKYEFIKNQKFLSDEKKRAKIIERKNHVKQNLEKRIEDENAKKEQIEDKIKDMGEEEIEILRRIKTTTKVHDACKL